MTTLLIFLAGCVIGAGITAAAFFASEVVGRTPPGPGEYIWKDADRD